MTMTTTRDEHCDRWPEGVPHDYTEFFEKYGPYIAGEVRRKNIVANNFDDLYQTVCERIVANQVLPKFVARVRASTDEELPPEMTGADACKLFGITFGAWRSKLWSYHKVFVSDLNGMVPVEGKTHGTIVRPSGAVVSWVAWMPTPVRGGYGSPNAVYRTSDVLEVPACGYFPKMKFDCAAWPRRKVQPHHLMGYISTAIHHIWYNFCRTERRKHRDRTGDCFAQFRNPDGEYVSNWEDTQIANETVVEDVELAIDYRTIVDRSCKMSEEQKGEISYLLKTHTITEAVKMSSLTAEQKRVLLSIAE